MDIRARDLRPGDRFGFRDLPEHAYEVLQAFSPETPTQFGFLEYRRLPGLRSEGLPTVTELERFKQNVIPG